MNIDYQNMKWEKQEYTPYKKILELSESDFYNQKLIDFQHSFYWVCDHLLKLHRDWKVGTRYSKIIEDTLSIFPHYYDYDTPVSKFIQNIIDAYGMSNISNSSDGV